MKTGKVGQFKLANEAVDLYQYDRGEIDWPKMEDLLVPLVIENKCYAVLRLNCMIENDQDDRWKDLQDDLRKIKEEFSSITLPFRLLSTLSKNDSDFLKKKFFEEVRVTYVDTIIQYLIGKTQEKDLRSSLDLLVRVLNKQLVDILSEEDKDNVINSLDKIHLVLKAYLNKPISVLSIWVVKMRLCLTKEPLLFHRTFPKGTSIDSEDIKADASICDLCKEFLNLPTFKVIQRLVDYGISKINKSDPVKHILLRMENGATDDLIFGTLLADDNRFKDGKYFFRHLYIFQSSQSKYISLLTRQELSVDEKRDLSAWWYNNKSTLSKTQDVVSLNQIILECEWELKDGKLDREAAYAVEGALQRFFWDGYRAELDLRKYEEVNPGKSLNQCLIDLKEKSLIIPLEPEQHDSQSSGEDCYKKFLVGTSTLGYKFSKSLGFRFLRILTIASETGIEYIRTFIFSI